MDKKEKVDDLCTVYREFDEEGREKMVGIVEKVLILQKEIQNKGSYQYKNEIKERSV